MPTALPNTRHVVEPTTHSHSHGWTCRLRIPGGVSVHSPMLVRPDGGLWLTGNVYGEGSYDACYFDVSRDGELLRVLKEDRGVLPEFLEGPDGTSWAVIVDPYGARDRTIVLPIDGRETAAEPKSMPADLGERATPTTWVKRPPRPSGEDRVTTMTFKKGVPVLGKPAKLPAPAHHQLVDGTEGLLGIAVVDQRSVLRAFAADGSVTRQRELSLGYLRPVRLAFEGESWLVGNEGPTVRWVTVSPDSSRATHDLFTLDEGEELYNIQIDTHDDCVALRFTTDRGPGFAFVRAGALVDAFRVDATGSAISRIGGDPISLGNGPQLVWGMKPCDHGYYVVTTPQVFHPEKATEFAVHRRVV